jgi:predicted  nucleic acid-binding Zn-ribbon protein
MPDAMTREEFAAALGGLETRLNTRTDRLEQSMIERFVKMDERFEHVDERFKEVHTRLTGLKDDIAEQFERVKIQFEEVRADLRFGLEGRESLREVMERRFEAARDGTKRSTSY